MASRPCVTSTTSLCWARCWLLAAGCSTGADYPLTGDKDLLALADNLPIVTPAQFWARHGGPDIRSSGCEFLRQRERNALLDTNRLRHFSPGKPADAVDDPPNEYFRGGSAGRDADPLPACQPCRIDFFRAIDQVAGDAAGNRHLLQAPRVGTVRAADDDHQVALPGQRLDGILTILRGVADVILLRTLNIGELLLEGSDDDRGIVDGQRGLGDEGELVRGADPRTPDAIRGLDQVNVRGAIS